MHDYALPFPDPPKRKRADATPADHAILLERLRHRRRALIRHMTQEMAAGDPAAPGQSHIIALAVLVMAIARSSVRKERTMTEITKPDLAGLATQINDQHDLAKAAFNRGFEHALRAGELHKMQVFEVDPLACIPDRSSHPGVRARHA